MPAEHIELLVGAAITIVISSYAYLLKRSVAANDMTVLELRGEVQELDISLHGDSRIEGLKTLVKLLESRVDDVESHHEKTDQQMLQLVESVKPLTSTVSANNVKTAIDLGEIRKDMADSLSEIKSSVSAIEGMLLGMRDKSN